MSAKIPQREEAIYLAENPDWAYNASNNKSPAIDPNNPQRNIYNRMPIIDSTNYLVRLSIIFVIYSIIIFFLFPWYFAGSSSTVFMHIFAIIAFFIVCTGAYALIIRMTHQSKPQKKYLNNTKEYTDNDIVQAQEETAKNEWTKICIHCGTKIFAEKEFCPSCGEKFASNTTSPNKVDKKTSSTSGEHSGQKNVSLSDNSTKPEWKICVHCGAKIFTNEIFCSNCGAEKP